MTKIIKKYRTAKQNDALHLYFEMIAQALNGEGLDVRLVLNVISEKGIDMIWSKELVKELLWRPIQKKWVGKHSTTELDSIGEITQIYDMLNKFLAENFFISPEFPSIQALIEKNETNNLHDQRHKIIKESKVPK